MPVRPLALAVRLGRACPARPLEGDGVEAGRAGHHDVSSHARDGLQGGLDLRGRGVVGDRAGRAPWPGQRARGAKRERPAGENAGDRDGLDGRADLGRDIGREPRMAAW